VIDHRIKDIKLINSDIFTFYDRKLHKYEYIGIKYQSYRGICLGFGCDSIDSILIDRKEELLKMLDDIDELYSPLLWEIHGIKE
jgi:hypothetical protein